MSVFARAFAYYEQRDYYTASKLFLSGMVTYDEMQWPEDATFGRAEYYYIKSKKEFCETEATLCKLYHTTGHTDFPEAAAWFDITLDYSMLTESPALPSDLKAIAERECLEAHGRYRKLLQTYPGYLKERPKRNLDILECK